MTAPRRRAVAAISCAFIFLAAACSSTSDKAEPLATGASDVAASGATGSAKPTATDAAGNPISGTGTATVGAKTSGAASGVTGGAPGLKGGPPVKVGMHYSEDLGAILTAFGAVDSTDGPGSDVINKTTKWINANGGMGGRKLEVVLHGGDALAGSFDAQMEEACTVFTQDNKVDYVVSGAAGTTPTLLECLYREKIPLLWNLHIALDRETFAKYKGYLYQPFSMSMERQGFYVDWLLDEGWAPKTAKVGMVLIDDPLHLHYRDRVIKPRLEANGMKITSQAVLPPPSGSSDAGALYAAMANGVLRFKQTGITHVLFAPTGGSLPFIFMNEAANQDYEPRYGFNSLDIPAFVDLNAPDGQLDGALAAGWLMTSDVLPPQRPKNSAERLCLAITNNRSDIASRYCEGLFFLKEAFDKGADNTPASVAATVKTFGTSYVSPWAFKTDFSSGRPDGASAARMLRWGGKCECFEYYGALRPVP